MGQPYLHCENKLIGKLAPYVSVPHCNPGQTHQIFHRDFFLAGADCKATVNADHSVKCVCIQ